MLPSKPPHSIRRSETHILHLHAAGWVWAMLMPCFDSRSHWDQLHEQPRFRPIYPNDHVVRFLMTNRQVLVDHSPARFLDIGMGAGRHTKLAAELGFQVCGTDISFAGLQHAKERLSACAGGSCVAQASMVALPFADSSFAAILSYGVFYYGTKAEMKQAIAEVHRVLAPKGKCFIVLRTTDDYRFGKGKQLEPNTFQLEISETNEYGTIQHFLSAPDVVAYFANFSRLSFERTDTSFADRTRVNSDWLIGAEK